MVLSRIVIGGLIFGSAALASMAGCGKPAPPPEGAKQDTTAPTIDLGTESGPQDAASSSDPTPGGSPQGGQGETK